ncbi:MAG TPA: hypothetical protein VJM34_13175 [Novosphingobium sp.]|nr:hypothetical protein [Novosphingobium sp.]
MDLNELFARHQTALFDMFNRASPDGRAWAEQCAGYYAERIEHSAPLLDGTPRIVDTSILKGIMHG